MTTPGVLTETQNELVTLLADWDYTGYFASGYAGDTHVVVVKNWPSDLLTNAQTSKNGMLTRPVVSVTQITPARLSGPGEGATLGDVLGAGAAAGTTRYGRRYTITFQVDCWADLQTGGGDQAALIADAVLDCVFVNRNSLAAFGPLKAEGGRSLYDEGSQLWRVPVTVWGRTQQSYDV